MRLSNEKARRLTALVWRERARRWLPIVAIVVVLTAAFAVYFGNQLARVDRTLEVKERDGTVVGTKRGGTGRTASIVQVHLDDGREVDAFTTFRVIPPRGSHVVVNEARHASGRLTYDIVRLIDQ